VTRFSEWISAMSPTTATEIALIIFLGVFVAVAFRHGRRTRAVEHAEAAQLPLEDDVPAPLTSGGAR
jgi:cbb3-type cytochrome oxidase subunit 3